MNTLLSMRLRVQHQLPFFKVIYDKKIKYVRVENDTRCKIHDEGPVAQIQLKMVILW